MSSTSIPNFVWWPIAFLIWALILPTSFLVGTFGYKIYYAKHLEVKMGEAYLKLDAIISNTRNSVHKIEAAISMPTAMKPCSYSLNVKSHMPEMSCDTYYPKKAKQISLLFKNEKQELEKIDKQLQELKAQLQANK